jgi:hypothetical protein
LAPWWRFRDIIKAAQTLVHGRAQGEQERLPGEKETEHEHGHGELPFPGGKAPWTVEAAHHAPFRYLIGSRGEQAHATLQIDIAR